MLTLRPARRRHLPRQRPSSAYRRQVVLHRRPLHLPLQPGLCAWRRGRNGVRPFVADLRHQHLRHPCIRLRDLQPRQYLQHRLRGWIPALLAGRRRSLRVLRDGRRPRQLRCAGQRLPAFLCVVLVPPSQEWTEAGGGMPVASLTPNARADNGIGEAICRHGNCRVLCPLGYALRRSSSSGTPFYCYNGPSSLRPPV